MSLIDTRNHQMFPVLTPAQVATATRFASSAEVSFRPEETIFDVGDRNAPTWLVLEGSIEIHRRDGLGHEKPITIHGAGEFIGLNADNRDQTETAVFGDTAPDRAGAYARVGLVHGVDVDRQVGAE